MRTRYYRREQERGQALVMVSVSLIAMLMIIAFAVDLGWAYYVRKSARASADAAALAGVTHVMRATVGTPTADRFDCGTDAGCTGGAWITCPAGNANLQFACEIAAKNGFSGSKVEIMASDAATAPTEQGPCGRDEKGAVEFIDHPPDINQTGGCACQSPIHGVETFYWVRVRITERIPALFSRIFGTTESVVSTHATAAAVRGDVIGSLILLNRNGDTSWTAGGAETDLYVSGSSEVNVPGGIVLSSTTGHTGWLQGGANVQTSATYLLSGAGIDAPSGSWSNLPAQYRPDGKMFEDPYMDKVQPPVDASTTNYYPVQDGELSCPTGGCPPGNYYTVRWSGSLQKWRATGEPIVVSNNQQVNFVPNATNPFTSATPDPSFVFFGGLQVTKGSVDFGPGRYVMAGNVHAAAGVDNTNGNCPACVFLSNEGTKITGGNGSDPGRMFILTDSSYGGKLDAAWAGVTGPHAVNGQTVDIVKDADAIDLDYGPVKLQAGAGGNGGSPDIRLYGLDRKQAGSKFEEYAPTLFWQDRDSHEQISMTANSKTVWEGVVYQPRNSTVVVHGGGGGKGTDRYEGALRIISGAMEVSASATVTLTSPSTPVTTVTAALIE